MPTALIMHLNFDAVALPFSGALQNAVFYLKVRVRLSSESLIESPYERTTVG